MASFEGKTIILGVTGSIAAYKAADLTSRLTSEGASVKVILTKEACEFITPLTFKTLSRNPVAHDLWAEADDWHPGHIDLADSADLFAVAPATAHTIACMAQGFAPDALTSTYLATVAPVVVAPAMNGKMFLHPATTKNLDILKDRGHHIVPPKSGQLACGYEGIGKLADLDIILDAFARALDEPPRDPVQSASPIHA